MSSPERTYADIAASGPPQSAEEARANPVPEIIPTDRSIDSLIDVDTGVSVVAPDFQEQEVKTETQAQRLEAEEAAAEERVATNKKTSKGEGEKKEAIKSFATSPIAQANGVVLAIFSIVLGVGAYRKHHAGQLSWKLAGMWGVGVATLAGADYCLSNYLWKNYPPRSKKE